jgi:glutamate-ammonia-ligase adenylyltransferase
MNVVRAGAFGLAWRPQIGLLIRDMRERLEESRDSRDLKRGFGGIVDIEFIVQLLQLKYAQKSPDLQVSNTWDSLQALASAGLLSPEEYETLREAYIFLRLVESRLRIVHNLSADELPRSPDDLRRLARRLGYEGGPAESPGKQFLSNLQRHTKRTRDLFLQIVARETENS